MEILPYNIIYVQCCMHVISESIHKGIDVPLLLVFNIIFSAFENWFQFVILTI